MEVGDIVTKYGTKYRLVAYINEATADLKHYSTGSKSRILLSKGNKTWAFEYWLCERASDGIEVVLSIQKPSEPIGTSKDYVDEGYDRKPGQYINDQMEVNLLTDSYDEYINNQRDLAFKDPVLAKKRKELAELIEFLGYQAGHKGKGRRSTRREPLRIGFRILYIHRQSPSWCGHQVFKKWCADYPKEHQIMKNKINDWLKSKESTNTAKSI